MVTIQDEALYGLTGEEAARRLAEDGPNELPTERHDFRVRVPRARMLARPGPPWRRLSVFGVVLGVYLWNVLTDHPDEVTRSVTFATLVIGNLALILVNRFWRPPLWRTFRERRNRTLEWILAAAVALLVVVLSVPGLRRAFDLGAISPADWVIALVAGFIGVAWFEICKVVARR